MRREGPSSERAWSTKDKQEKKSSKKMLFFFSIFQLLTAVNSKLAAATTVGQKNWNFISVFLNI